MKDNLLKKLSAMLMAGVVVFTPITAGCNNKNNNNNNNNTNIEQPLPDNDNNSNSGNNSSDNTGNNTGNENPQPEQQHSELLNLVLNNAYYNNLIANSNLVTRETDNKFQTIPYKYLEDKGYNVNKIKNNQLKCEGDVFLYNNELYIALKTEVEASTNYFECQILKYQITEKEIADLNKLFVRANHAASSYKTTYVQAPFMIQHLSYTREPVELLATPTRITPEASSLCNKNISGRQYFGYDTNSIYLGDDYVEDSVRKYKYTFMMFKNCDHGLTMAQTSKLGIVTFSAALGKTTDSIYSHNSYDVASTLLEEDKTAFQESIITVKIYNSKNAGLYDYTELLNNLSNN